MTDRTRAGGVNDIISIVINSRILIGFLASMLVLTNGFWWWTGREQFRVTSVYDGDTFWLKSGDRVKLIGVNTPEIGRCLAEDSKEKLSNLVMGKVIDLKEIRIDEWGRKMGLVYIGGTLVNLEIMKAGLAKPDYTPNSRSDDLKEASRTASKNKIGVYGDKCKGSKIPLDEKCVIKGNIDKSTGKHYYHLPSCRHYLQVVLDLDTAENYFCSESEAVKAGFDLAPDCLR